jgi:signal transduction histidine kinase
MRMGRVTKAEKVREYGEYIENESRRLTALINNILDFSKIESAEKKYQMVETDLAEIVTQTVAAFETPLREAGVRVQVAMPSRPLPPMLLDRGAIGQAMVNLLDNAVKYSGESPWIRVTIAEEPRVVRVSVQDRGIGVPPEEQKKVFDKFYRVGSSLVHDVKGSGLGLSIVKHIAQAHGGDVELASAAGEGSTFTLVLPRRRAPETVISPASEGHVSRAATEGHA